MGGGVGNEMGEALESDRIAGVKVSRHRIVKGKELSHSGSSDSGY
jgi:hypothetical protein